MSTVKISDLPEITHLNTNTANTLAMGVDLETGVTGKMTITTLAEGLYSHNALNVGNNEDTYPDTIAQFAGTSNNYIQVNLENIDNDYGSADYIVGANTGSDTTYFIDLGFANKNYNNQSVYNGLGTSMYALDGYLYVQGNTSSGYPGGNLIIGTVTTGTNVHFIAGGANASNIIVKVTNSGLKINGSSYLIFSDDSIQRVAASPANYSQAAYAQANVTIGVDVTQNSRMTIIEGTDVTQNTAISSTNGKMESAYNKANNALANTSSIITAGSLQVSGNTLITGLVDVINPNIANNAPLVQINASDDGSYVAPSNTYYMLHITGKANSSTRLVLDSFGSNTYPLLSGRSARGTANVPTATANNDVLMRVVGNGYTGTQFPSSSPTKIDFVATENFSNTNRGTEIQFWNTTKGSNTLVKIATFNSEEVMITGHLTPQKGFVWYPRTFPAAQTAITLDFSSDSVIRTNTSSGLVVSFANYTPGKVVDMWITNTAGTGQTFTHGCSALNSTVNATTYSIPATSTIYVKYICFDGDVANTFCAITHS